MKVASIKRIPVLPCDCLRMIYARKWRLEAQGRAVCVIQRAVRRAIIRAQGDPWDLPPLVDSDALYSLCFGTLVQCRRECSCVRACVRAFGLVICHALAALLVSAQATGRHSLLPAMAWCTSSSLHRAVPDPRRHLPGCSSMYVKYLEMRQSPRISPSSLTSQSASGHSAQIRDRLVAPGH
jgi:hypothetical protein